MKISFIGHSHVVDHENVKILVKEQIRLNIGADDKVVCYLGGYGDFDMLCACACRELKREYMGIELVYVTPYLDVSSQLKIRDMITGGLYDSSVYPPIERTPLRYAISKRNNWMMENADVIIAYVHLGFGGAFKTVEFAKRRKKKIINVCDLM